MANKDLTIKADTWLSAQFGFPAYEIIIDDDANGKTSAVLTSLRREPGKAFYFCKVATTAIKTVHSLMNQQFYVVDVNLNFKLQNFKLQNFKLQKEPQLEANNTHKTISIVSSDTADTESILNIANTCFIYSRFHLDPNVPNSLANHIKREWIHNYIKKYRGDTLFVAIRDGQVCGFLAAICRLYQGSPCAIIDLIGVNKKIQGMGVGSALIKHFINYYGRSHQRLIVGTQAANIPSINLYEKHGFRLCASSYTLHSHNPPVEKKEKAP